MEALTLDRQAAIFMEGVYALDKLYDEYAKSVGLTTVGLRVLTSIHEAGGPFTQKEISQQLGLPKQSINLVIRSLWDRGLVEMRELDSDRRNKEIWLNQQGQEYTLDIVSRLMEAFTAAFGRLSYAQRQEINHLLQEITKGFMEITGKTPEEEG